MTAKAAANGTTTDKTEPVAEKETAIAETPVPVKTEPAKKENEKPEPIATPVPLPKKETRTELPEVKSEVPPPLPQPATVTTKSGRASKPSTPALATFQEAAAARASRARIEGAKKSQRKNSIIHAAQADDDATSSMQEEEEGDIDGDEPTYCYCNSVSYGEMVACDSDDCEREWFHLACVGLKVAPGSKSMYTLGPTLYVVN